GEHDLIAERAQDGVVPVLVEVEQVRADRPDGRELLPLLHDLAARYRVAAVQGAVRLRPVGELPRCQLLGLQSRRIDVGEVTGHWILRRMRSPRAARSLRCQLARRSPTK